MWKTVERNPAREREEMNVEDSRKKSSQRERGNECGRQ